MPHDLTPLDDWENEGGSPVNEWDEFLDDLEECPRCGEIFDQPGSPCQVCGFDPLYDS